MWSSRLFWKLFSVAAGLNLILAVVFFVVVTVWQRPIVNEQVRQRLTDIASVARPLVMDQLVRLGDDGLDSSNRETILAELQDIAQDIAQKTNTRVSLVQDDGHVVADSERDPADMLNHRDRDELVAARDRGWGWAIRRSPTLGIDMHYVALSVESQGQNVAFVRIATEIAKIDQRLSNIRWFLGLFALGIGLTTTVLTYYLVGRMIRPLAHLTVSAKAISAGRDREPVAVESRDEVGTLAVAFNQMQSQLTQRVGQLHENNERLATVLGGMDDGVIAVDADEHILFANETSRQFLDIAASDIVGRPLLEVARNRAVHEAIQQALKTQSTIQTEFEAASDQRRQLLLRASCLPGQPCPGVVVVIHNVSELRRLEALRRELVANVSHELKTPLAAIKAYAETLRLGAINDTENNLNFVTRIEEQADRLHQLILDMIQIARIESGRETFEITDVNIADIAQACAEHYSHEAALKNIHLTIESKEQPLAVRADRDGLRTILENLVDNAIKYTPQNGRVAIRWHADKSHGVLVVSDTGIGISAADQARVFERFYRADKARSRERGGTGLGLSIVKHLSQAFGGSVSLESVVGQGSTFRVRLPLS